MVVQVIPDMQQFLRWLKNICDLGNAVQFAQYYTIPWYLTVLCFVIEEGVTHLTLQLY